MEKLQQILQRLARFRMVAELKNKNSKLDGSFNFRISGGEQLEQLAGTFYVHDGDTLNIEFQNTCTQTLYYAIFNLTPQWAVEQLTPEPDEESIGVECKRKSDPLEIKMEIPEMLHSTDMTEIRDVLKVIVTTTPSSFGMLQSPAVPYNDGDDWRSDSEMGSPQELEDVLQNLKDSSRNAKVMKTRYGDWQSDQIIIVTKRQEGYK